MRPILIIASFVMCSVASAQATGELDVNTLRPLFLADGTMREVDMPDPFWTPSCYTNLWMGGYDAQDSLHMAAVRFNQVGEDYWPGPLSIDGSASTIGTVSNQWDRVWKVTAAEVNEYSAFCACANDPNCDTALQFPGYQMPPDIGAWPAHFPQQGFAPQYAPFVDNNGDGVYNPADCDVPCSPGDQSLYFVFNDNLAAHTKTGGTPLGMEVQTRAFAYAGPDAALQNSFFIEYRLINRSSITYTDFRLGLWSDADLFESRPGCDVGRSLFYMYSDDTTLYDMPHAIGWTLVCGLFADADQTDTTAEAALVAYNGYGVNDGTVDNERQGMMRFATYGTGNPFEPVTATDHYDRLRGVWNDSTPCYYGGYGHYTSPMADTTTEARFFYPGDTDPLGFGTAGVPQAPWYHTDDLTVDERIMGCMGPLTFAPGAVNRFLVAFTYVATTDPTPAATVGLLQARVDSVLAFAAANDFCGGLRDALPCGPGGAVTVAQVDELVGLELFPVPTADVLTVRATLPLPQGSFAVVDPLGRTVAVQAHGVGTERTIDVSALGAGHYTLVHRGARSNAFGRFVKL